MTAERLPRLGFLLLAILTLFWGTSWPIMKIALGEILPWTFRSLCIFFGGLGILVTARVTGSKLTIPGAELRPLILVALFNSTCWHLGSAYGLIYMKAGRAAIIAFTMPVWASILGVFILGERLTWARLLGLCFGIAGLFILIAPDIRTIGSAPLGAVFMLGAAVSWALGTVFLKYFHWTMPTAVLAGWQTLLGGIPVIIGALIFEPITALLQVSWRGILETGTMLSGSYGERPGKIRRNGTWATSFIPTPSPSGPRPFTSGTSGTRINPTPPTAQTIRGSRPRTAG